MQNLGCSLLVGADALIGPLENPASTGGFFTDVSVNYLKVDVGIDPYDQSLKSGTGDPSTTVR